MTYVAVREFSAVWPRESWGCMSGKPLGGGGVVSSPLVEPHHACLAYHPCLVNLNLTLANSSSRMSTEEGHHELGISDPILLNDVRGEGEEECKESTMAESQERNEDLTEPKADDTFRLSLPSHNASSMDTTRESLL